METAYIFNGDVYCEDLDCVVISMISQGVMDNMRLFGMPLPGGCGPEKILELYASALGIDLEDERNYDSDQYPKPFVVSQEEVDYPNHCTTCDELIPCRLTDVGREYVQERIASGAGSEEVLQTWYDEYGYNFKGEQS